MCDPVSAMAAISSTMSIMGAVEGQKAQEQAFNANRKNALQGQADEQRQINLQQAQEDTKAAQEKVATDLEVREQMSRATVAGLESGADLNNNVVLQDMQRQGLMANTQVGVNLDNTLLQMQEERLGSKTRAQSRINSVSKPSKAATSLKIGQAIVGGMQDSGKFS